MSQRTRLSRITLALVLCCVVFHDRSGLAEDVLTNADVVKMGTAGLGDEIIIAKIQATPRVNFDLAVDDLVALRKAGVSERVVHAMLERTKVTPTRRAAPATAEKDFGISLKTSEGTTPLHKALGEISAAGFGPFANVFLNYPGLRSAARTRDKRPSLLVTCPFAPEVGHYFLAKLDPDKRHGVRSLKVGKAVRRTGEPGGRLAPDADWVIPFEVKEESPGTWRVTVQRDLESGEYGWYVNLDTTPMGNVPIEGLNTIAAHRPCFQGASIFDFGID